MVEETNSASDLANSVSGGTEFGGAASDQNEIGRASPGPRGFENAVNAVVGSSSALGILSCFMVSAFDRKVHQLGKQELVMFLTKRDSVIEETMGKIFQLYLTPKGSVLSLTEMSNINILLS